MRLAQLGRHEMDPRRQQLAAIGDEAIRRAERLVVLSNKQLERGAQIPKTMHFTMMLGTRARNALIAIRELLGRGVDDQIGVLGRSLAETAIDLENLHTDTVRHMKHREVPLTHDVKATLYGSFRVLQEERHSGAVAPIRQADLAAAKSFRKKHGITNHLTWHGTTVAKAYGEIYASYSASEEPSRQRVNYLYRAFQVLSMYTHPSPLDPAYIVPSRNKGAHRYLLRKRKFTSCGILGVSLAGGLDVLLRWSVWVDRETETKLNGLIQQLYELGNLPPRPSQASDPDEPPTLSST